MFIGEKKKSFSTIYFVAEETQGSTNYSWTDDIDKATRFKTVEKLTSALKKSGMGVQVKELRVEGK